jgi:hypothetical protein
MYHCNTSIKKLTSKSLVILPWKKDCKRFKVSKKTQKILLQKKKLSVAVKKLSKEALRWTMQIENSEEGREHGS